MCKNLVGFYADIDKNKAEKFKKAVREKGLKQRFALEEALEAWSKSVKKGLR